VFYTTAKWSGGRSPVFVSAVEVSSTDFFLVFDLRAGKIGNSFGHQALQSVLLVILLLMGVGKSTAMTANEKGYPVVGPESLMSENAHGTCPAPVQDDLRYGCDFKTADNICCFNRHYAEHSGYWVSKTSFLKDVDRSAVTTFFDSVTGKPLFKAPIGRSFEAFEKESRAHGWPSFRDEEVIWENVRCLANGEAVSVDGTHLGHNLPDGSGNRYCINLVSCAGNPVGPQKSDL
jgi:peptide methionine sulfoxide reductase MsrB